MKIGLNFKTFASIMLKCCCSKNYLALCFGKCSKQLQIRLQKHDGNEQRRKSAGLNMMERWLGISVPETWQNQVDLNFHVFARRKHSGNMELHVSATFQKYGNTWFRPVCWAKHNRRKVEFSIIMVPYYKGLYGVNKVLLLLNQHGDPSFLFPNLRSYNIKNQLAKF